MFRMGTRRLLPLILAGLVAGAATLPAFATPAFATPAPASAAVAPDGTDFVPPIPPMGEDCTFTLPVQNGVNVVVDVVPSNVKVVMFVLIQQGSQQTQVAKEKFKGHFEGGFFTGAGENFLCFKNKSPTRTIFVTPQREAF